MRASYKPRPGWTKFNSTRWDYRVAGYRVRHCGHPTTLWQMILAPTRRGFSTLNAAQVAVEAEALGRS
jgi:hypothetical protein